MPTSKPSVAAGTLPSLALLGKAGSGKDTAAELLAEAYGYERLAFADTLKDTAAWIWGNEGRSDREKLQRLGVAVREIDGDAWVNAALRKLDDEGHLLKNKGSIVYPGGGPYQEYPVVVTDVRFPNEVSALLTRGFVTVRVVANRSQRVNRLVAINKLQDEAQLNHVSETALDDYVPDYMALNTGTKEELGERLCEIVEVERARRG